MEFTDNNKVFNISSDFTKINYNNELINTIKIHTASKINCKLETNNYIIKFSKGQLFVYNKQNDLLDTFEFSRFINFTEGTEVAEVNEVSGVSILGKYELKKNYIIQLTESHVINNNINEEIINVTNIGSFWTEYTTEFNNKLTISNIPKRFHNKFNGIPISLNLV